MFELHIARTDTGRNIIVQHQHRWQESELTATPELPKKSALSFDSITKSRKRLVAVMLTLLLVGGVTGFYVSQISFPRIIRPALAQGVRAYTLEVKPTDITVAQGSTWHAWTYNGSVPGPTLKGKVGEILQVTVINKDTSLKHSFHTHLAPYRFEYDGSQANVIDGRGAGGMVPPNGGIYLYEFQLTAAGLFYYHCHSSDGGHPINEHMLRGLYGAIIVDEPDAAQIRDIPIFMAERAGPVDTVPGGTTPATFIMNGFGIPGGEMTLEQIFASGGLGAVAAEFNKTVLAYSTFVGTSIRLHIINIGNLDHSFHLHGTNVVSQWYFPGRIWPANVVQLVPGAADSVVITPQYTGLWLFHCHVVSHADAGMIGVLQVV